MIRLPGLQQRVALALAASRPARRLAQELEGALGRARVGVGEADIGVDHADEGQQREIMALGDELGADDEVERAARGRVELAAQSLDAAGKVGRQHQHARVGKRSAASSASRSTPGPQAARLSTSWHSGQSLGRGSTWPQWWQTRAERKRCSTSQAAQFGHSNRWPQERQRVRGA